MNKSICVIGAGDWGKNHIKTLHKLNSLKGVVELNDITLCSLANKYPKIQLHQSVEDALCENYDGYIIATPAMTHYEIAKKVIKSGKSLLIEKPLTLLVHEAEDLVSLAKEKNVSAMVGHVLLFHPAITKIKEMIENGDIGELQYIYSNRLNLGKVRTEENVFWSLAPHDIAIFQHIIGSIPEKISAKGSTFLQEGIPDSTLTQLEYENGIKGHIFVSWLHPFKEHRLVVIGSEAMISFEDSLNEKPLKFYSKKIDLKSGVPKKIDGPVKMISFENRMPLEIELEYFCNHLMDIKPEISNINHGYEVVKTLVEASNQILR
ncbi:MAG: Gfo/Idh/MocA family protein [Candidatus Neomarinimicrobiota bacterium]